MEKIFSKEANEKFERIVKEWTTEKLNKYFDFLQFYSENTWLFGDDLPSHHIMIRILKGELNKRIIAPEVKREHQFKVGDLYQNNLGYIMQVIQVNPIYGFADFVDKAPNGNISYVRSKYPKDINATYTYIGKPKALFEDVWKVNDQQ